MSNKKELVRFNSTLPINIYTELKRIAQESDRSLNNIANMFFKEYCDNHPKDNEKQTGSKGKKELIRFNGTLPIHVYAELKRIANERGHSLNNVINVILNEYCGAPQDKND